MAGKVCSRAGAKAKTLSTAAQARCVASFSVVPGRRSASMQSYHFAQHAVESEAGHRLVGVRGRAALDDKRSAQNAAAHQLPELGSVVGISPVHGVRSAEAWRCRQLRNGLARGLTTGSNGPGGIKCKSRHL